MVAGCGGDDDGSGDSAKAAGGGSLTVYSSLPLQGASKNQARAIRNGMKLALEQAGGKVGDHTIKYVSLDDSTAQAGAWTPEATSANARKAAQDDSTIAYLGEFNSGASAVSIPILNETGVPAERPHQHGRRPHHRRAPARSPASRTSTTRAASATTCASCPRTTSRAPRWSR